jgi:hypothetical protein
MDASSFFVGTGIAIFIALLAWGNQISKPREDLLGLEERYIHFLRRKKKQILPLLRHPSKYKSTQVMKALMGFVGDSKTGEEEIALIEEIKGLHKVKKELEGYYVFRYYAVITLTVCSFFFSYLSIMYGKANIAFQILGTKIPFSFNTILMVAFFAFIMLIIRNMIITGIVEKRFMEALYTALDRIEE